MAGLAAPTTTLAHLPGSNVYAATTDAAGNIYFGGFQGTFTKANPFVTKLSSTGQTLYSTTFAGSGFGITWAIATDSSGDAYVFGTTSSADFPVTPGALQTTLQAARVQGFAAKLDPNGKVVYSTFIGGSSDIYPGLYLHPGLNSLVVDSAGDAILTGQTITNPADGVLFPPTAPPTSGAPFTSTDTNTNFVIKLDPLGGKILAAVRGIGGAIATDGQGNLYVAGVQTGNSATPLPVTPGAFQSAAANGNQYVAKLNAGLTQIVYLTYVSGKYGASPVAISVNAQGNLFVTGTTNSPDYPTTANAYEPQYVASAIPKSCFFIIHCVTLPPASGYLTELNATGTGLVYSSYFSGTQTDSVTFAAFTPNAIYLAGSAGSADLPGFTGFPQPCLPQNYVTRMSADATEIGASRIAPGNVLAYDAFAGTLITSVSIGTAGADLVAIDPNAPKTPIACILDSADLQPVTSIVPGELVSMFGEFSSGSASSPPNGQFPASLGGVTVAVNGLASPLLYAGPEQINFQTPFAIAGAAQANIALASALPNLSDSRTLPIAATNPVAFLNQATPAPPSSALATCIDESSESVNGLLPLSFNPDGSLNTCLNPAAAGSVVTMFLDGLGVTSPAQLTGTITPNPGLPLNSPVITANGGVTVASVSALPGAISGVWQIGIRIPANQTSGGFQLSLSADGTPVRDANLVVWVK